MEVNLTIKNYRCFPDSRPARICIRPGFTAFLGVNNSGKSSLLKFFYELRFLFEMIRPGTSNVLEAIKGKFQSFRIPPTIEDINQIFCRSNSRNIEIEVKIESREQKTTLSPVMLVINIPRGTSSFSVKLVTQHDRVLDPKNFRFEDQEKIRVGPSPAYPVYDLSGYFKAFEVLRNTCTSGRSEMP